MSIEYDKDILDSFEPRALSGEIVTAQYIKAVFDKKLGMDTERGYI